MMNTLDLKSMIVITITIMAIIDDHQSWSAPVANGSGEPMIVNKDYDYQTNRPIVKLIKDGYIECHQDGGCYRSSNVVYIYDGPDCQIIVDTGVPSDIRYILRGLSENDVLPTSISLVISTHLHADHTGNTNLFSYARYLAGNHTITKDTFAQTPWYRQDNNESEGYEVAFLCPNVGLLKVKGHTDLDLVVLVYNATDYGNVTVTGDIFLSEEDVWTNGDGGGGGWLAESAYPDDQRRARRVVIQDSDYLIPGHGAPFPVTEPMRRAVFDQDPSTRTCSCLSAGDPASKYTAAPEPTDSGSSSGSGSGSGIRPAPDEAAPFDLASHPALQNDTTDLMVMMNNQTSPPPP